MRQKLNKLTTVFTRSDRSLHKVRQLLQIETYHIAVKINLQHENSLTIISRDSKWNFHANWCVQKVYRNLFSS